MIVALAAAAVLAGGGWYWHARLHERGTAAKAPPPDATAPPGQRIRVQVLNATRINGLARRATYLLRNRGFDVVEIGTSGTQQDSTLVIARSDHLPWARRVADALGGARVESRPDSTLYVDVTVLLGRTWRAPPEPLHP